MQQHEPDRSLWNPWQGLGKPELGMAQGARTPAHTSRAAWERFFPSPATKLA